MAAKTIEQILSQDHVTLYEVSKIVNHHGGKIPSQMMYNYANKGLIKTTLVDDQKVVDIQTALAFVWGYFDRKANPKTKKSDETTEVAA